MELKSLEVGKSVAGAGLMRVEMKSSFLCALSLRGQTSKCRGQEGNLAGVRVQSWISELELP